MSNLIKLSFLLIMLALAIAVIAERELVSTTQPGLISLSWERIQNFIKE